MEKPRIRNSYMTSVRVDRDVWNEFQRIYPNASLELRNFIMLTVLNSKIEVLENVK